MPGDIIILHLCTTNDNHDAWFLIYFVILGYFLPFYAPPPPQQSRKSKFWKNKKSSWKHYHLHKCTINDNHMIYGSWDIKCNRQLFLSSLVIFYPFTPLKPKKRKYQKIEKKQNTCRYHVPKTMIIGYTVAEIWCVPDVIIFHFDLFFTLSPP